MLLRWVSVVAVLSVSSLGFSFSEFSLSTTGYTSTDNKVSGSDSGSSSQLSVAGRYAEPMTDRLHWFSESGLEFNSYSAAGGGKAPSDSVNITLGGGARLYFPDFSEAIFPFLSVNGGLIQTESATLSSGGYSQTSVSGLFYGASSGFRFDLDQDFFLDVSADLFNAPLFSTAKTKVVNSAGTTTSETEESTMALQLDTIGTTSNLEVAVGMKL